MNERPYKTQLDFLARGDDGVIAVEAKFTEQGFARGTSLDWFSAGHASQSAPLRSINLNSHPTAANRPPLHDDASRKHKLFRGHANPDRKHEFALEFAQRKLG